MRNGATEVELEIVATGKGELVIEIENWGKSKIKGPGPQWKFKLDGFKAGTSYRALAKVTDNSKTVSRKFFFKTILARPFITLAELRADKKGSSSPIISPLFMENVRVLAPDKLYKNSVIMAIEKYGLHSYSIKERKTNWHRRELCKIFNLRLFDDMFVALGTDEKLRCFRSPTGKLLWTKKGVKANPFSKMFFTKAGVFVWQNSGPTRFSARNGEMSWQVPSKNLTLNWMVTNELVYVVDKQKYLRVYEAESGKRRSELDRELFSNVASAIVEGDGCLLLGLFSSSAMIIKPGEEPIFLSSAKSRFCNVVGFGPKMVICSFVKPPELAAYSLADGSLIWQKPIVSKVKTAFTVRGRKLYYGDMRDFLVAVDIKSGQKLWERYGNLVARFRLHATSRGILYCSSSLALNEVIDGLEP